MQPMRYAMLVVWAGLMVVAGAGDAVALKPGPEYETARIDTYLQQYHDRMAREFGEQMGFGSGRMKRLLDFHRPTRAKDIELLGVINHEKPVAYKNPLPILPESKATPANPEKEGTQKAAPPRENLFSSAEKRPLTKSETEALDALKKGGALKWIKDETVVRAVGALRANAACIECHTAKPGDLLGALSYTIDASTIKAAVKPESAAALRQEQPKTGAEQKAEK
jgi:hypothetical protein